MEWILLPEGVAKKMYNLSKRLKNDSLHLKIQAFDGHIFVTDGSNMISIKQENTLADGVYSIESAPKKQNRLMSSLLVSDRIPELSLAPIDHLRGMFSDTTCMSVDPDKHVFQQYFSSPTHIRIHKNCYSVQYLIGLCAIKYEAFFNGSLIEEFIPNGSYTVRVSRGIMYMCTDSGIEFFTSALAQKSILTEDTVNVDK